MVNIFYGQEGNVETEYYCINNHLHRNDGPAKIKYNENGTIKEENYYQNGLLHKINGPAIIWYNEDGTVAREEYWINGIHYDDVFQYSVMVACIGEII